VFLILLLRELLFALLVPAVNANDWDFVGVACRRSRSMAAWLLRASWPM